MIEAAAEFVQALKASARRLDAYFVLDGTKYHPLSYSLENNVYSSENDSFIGTFIARSGKLKINPADSLNLENKWVEMYQGIMVSGTFQYKKIGSFLAYDKDDSNEYSIIDKKALFNETAPIDEISYPMTPLQLAQWVCTKVGVPLASVSFPNANLSIPEAISFGEQPVYADIITAIAQASCTFARITADDVLDFRWFSQSDFRIDQKNLAESWPEGAERYGPVNSLVLARKPLNDNVYIQNEESIEENGLTELKISNNPILDIDRHTSKTAIFERIDGFSYIPVNCKSQGFFIIEPGDIIQLQLKDQSYIEVYVMNHSISYSGSSRSSFETPALTKSQIQYQYAESVKQALKRTEAIVDKQNQQIQLIIEKQEQQTEVIIGGRNLLRNSSFNDAFNGFTLNEAQGEITINGITYEGNNAASLNRSDYAGEDPCNISTSELLIPITYDEGDQYILSASIYVETALSKDDNSICVKNGDDTLLEIAIPADTITGKWLRYVSPVFEAKGSGTFSELCIGIKENGALKVSAIKLEAGNHATAWSPAPEDQTQYVDDAITETEIEITQDYSSMIDSTADQITLMVEQLRTETDENATSIASISNELQITSDMAQFVKTTTEQLQQAVDGKVDETTIQEWARFDGATLELGTSDSPFKCRLSNTELAFYQGSNKVAWISNNELHVLTAVITTSIGCGDFKFIDEGNFGFSLL